MVAIVSHHNPNLCNMIVIKVFANWEALNIGRPLFERQIAQDPAICFPVDKVVSVLKFLFGAKSVVLVLFD